MKKNSFLLLISLPMLCLFYSCTGGNIETQDFDYSHKFFLCSDTSKGALEVEFHVSLPTEFRNSEVLDTIKTQLLTFLFGDEFQKQKSDSVLKVFANSLNKEYLENNAPLLNELDSSNIYSFNNEHKLEGFSLLNDKKIFSYGVDRYVYMGGAHGLNTRLYYNFDLQNGHLISEKDIFKENSKGELSKLIKSKILEDLLLEKNANTEKISSLDDTDYWTDSIMPNGNFYITVESINYVYNPYEIAPYYMGHTDVELPFEKISNLIKKNSVIDYLIANTKK